MPTMKRLLWVDDDGEDRFLFERSILEDQGMVTDWARDATEAVVALQEKDYSLVLLDQVFPILQESSYKDVWSGCRLLYWLRGRKPPAGAPQGAAGWASFLHDKKALAGNQNIPVIIISGFQDDHVDQALEGVSPGIDIFPKPVDGDKLIETIVNLLAQPK